MTQLQAQQQTPAWSNPQAGFSFPATFSRQNNIHSRKFGLCGLGIFLMVVGAIVGSLITVFIRPMFSVPAGQEAFWWSAVGSGSGAFFGFATVFFIRWGFQALRSKPQTVQRYDAVSTLNRGARGEQNGELKHHFGEITTDPDNPKRQVWSCTNQKAGDHDAEASAFLYGPYSNDCDEPGVYIARFRVRGVQFPKPEEIDVDRNLIELDVAQNYHVLRDNGWGGVNSRVAVAYVKTKSLARAGWYNYDVRFHSDARGTWEYRVIKYEDNLSRYGHDARVLVDSVIVLKCASSFPLPQI